MFPFTIFIVIYMAVTSLVAALPARSIDTLGHISHFSAPSSVSTVDSTHSGFNLALLNSVIHKANAIAFDFAPLGYRYAHEVLNNTAFDTLTPRGLPPKPGRLVETLPFWHTVHPHGLEGKTETDDVEWDAVVLRPVNKSLSQAPAAYNISSLQPEPSLSTHHNSTVYGYGFSIFHPNHTGLCHHNHTHVNDTFFNLLFRNHTQDTTHPALNITRLRHLILPFFLINTTHSHSSPQFHEEMTTLIFQLNLTIVHIHDEANTDVLIWTHHTQISADGSTTHRIVPTALLEKRRPPSQKVGILCLTFLPILMWFLL